MQFPIGGSYTRSGGQVGAIGSNAKGTIDEFHYGPDEQVQHKISSSATEGAPSGNHISDGQVGAMGRDARGSVQHHYFHVPPGHPIFLGSVTGNPTFVTGARAVGEYIDQRGRGAPPPLFSTPGSFPASSTTTFGPRPGPQPGPFPTSSTTTFGPISAGYFAIGAGAVGQEIQYSNPDGTTTKVQKYVNTGHSPVFSPDAYSPSASPAPAVNPRYPEKEFGKQKLGKISYKGNVFLNGTTADEVRSKQSVTAENATIGTITAKGEILAIQCLKLGTLTAKGPITTDGCKSIGFISSKDYVSVVESTVSEACRAKKELIVSKCPQSGTLASKTAIKVSDCQNVASILSKGTLELDRSTVIGDVSTSSTTTIEGSNIYGTLSCKSHDLAAKTSEFNKIIFTPPAKSSKGPMRTTKTYIDKKGNPYEVTTFASPFSVPDGKVHIRSDFIDERGYIEGKPLYIDGKTLPQWKELIASGHVSKLTSDLSPILKLDNDRTTITSQSNPNGILIDQVPWKTWLSKPQIGGTETITLIDCIVQEMIFEGGNGEVTLVGNSRVDKLIGGKIKK